MKIKTREVGDVTVVEINGKITIGEGDVALRNTIKELLEKGRKKIVIDMKNVSYMDSSGVGELASAYTTTKKQGGELKLANLNTKVHDLLQLTTLISIFEVFDSTAEACASFE
ncbi:anti-sigma B factor antagonist [Thermotomaculum hydrothermale]|uniref:Anti-sigma factor antagonist n=1 Tax=Thermotomaculum hydrothermale TaxID=981385 RepID=A0A7R6SYW4_9BACT|nr:STAS domain-containing protein [Thermotomaculum hydrothermale]BBB32220.1 anti-sigma B factor antagonist [Thermotomaculum hydrothermale]